MSRRVLAGAAGAAALAAGWLAPGAAAAQYCPSYTPSSSAPNDCAIEAADGTNPSAEEWSAIFDLVSRGPAAWGDAGPSVADIGQGCGKPEPLHDVPARYPCELLKAITMQESRWLQFCEPTEPSDQTSQPSQTIISFDCGYGIGQITSGMHTYDPDNPDFDRQRVAADPTYNLATGTRILADKWRATSCVGDNQPSVIEHWYIATWAYNGQTYVNNPNNPNYDPFRGVWDPSAPHAAPYQEKVFGWMEHDGGMWEPTALAYPNPGELGDGGVAPEIGDPHCASPTDCASTRSTHVSSCLEDGGTGGGGGAGGGGAGAGGGSGSGSPTTGAGAAGAGSGGSGGAGDDSDDGGADAGGCGCRLPASGRGQASGAASLLLLSLAGLLAARARVRRG